MTRLMQAALSFAALMVVTSAAQAQPQVRTDAGTIRGKALGATEAYMGVPFAKPPVGSLRWRAPEPVAPWTGVRDATRPSAVCYQMVVKPWDPYPADFVADGPVSEDCLYLNVWKPAHPQAKLPVYVFIHGGGFRGGAGSLGIYDGSDLAAKGAVVVTINYRVGAFGFLAHPDLSRESKLGSSGNYGILDQIAALRWVQANIARLGGDPRNVTVAGESAGAASVNSLIVSPLAKGLFHRAVSMSGPVLGGPMTPRGDAEQNGVALAAEAGGGSIEGLRALSAEAVLDATKGSPPGTPGAKPVFSYAPNLDGKVIAVDPGDGRNPVQVRVPLLAGYNADEMVDYKVTTPDTFRAAVARRYGAFADRFLALYPHATDEEAIASNLVLNRDRYMAALVLWGQQRAKTSGQPVYAYLYDHRYPVGPGGKDFGAFHSSSLRYIFGALTGGDRAFTDGDRAVSRQMQAHWLAFMMTGNPSADGTQWPRFGAASVDVMGVGDTHRLRPAVSSPERLKLFGEFVAAGGRIGLI